MAVVIYITYFLSIQVGDVHTLSPCKTQHGQVWIERSIEMESRMAHPCHGAVNKPSADVHRRIPERNFTQVHLFTQKTHKKQQKIINVKTKKYTNINMQYSVHHFSPESLVQSSDTYNRQEAVYTRTSSLQQGGIGACQAFSTDTCCYI